MAKGNSFIHLLFRPRGRAFLLPREHGAWGMLLVPMVTGIAAGHPSGVHVVWIALFATAALALFFLRTPLEAGLGVSVMRPQGEAERRLVGFAIGLYAFAALAPLVVLMVWVNAYGLLVLGGAAAMALVFQALLKQVGRKSRARSAASPVERPAVPRREDARRGTQLVGAVALSSTSAGVYYLATGRLDATAMIIWLANALFAADQIHFVQVRIHSARAGSVREKLQEGRGLLLHQAGCLLLLAWFWRAGWLPGLVITAFGPLFVRAVAWILESPRPLRVRRLGVSELVYAVMFGVFFIVSYHYPKV